MEAVCGGGGWWLVVGGVCVCVCVDKGSRGWWVESGGSVKVVYIVCSLSLCEFWGGAKKLEGKGEGV